MLSEDKIDWATLRATPLGIRMNVERRSAEALSYQVGCSFTGTKETAVLSSYFRPVERCKSLTSYSGIPTYHPSYADAIPLLYSSNTFDFDSMEGLLSLSCAVLPQRFDTIQSVKLDYRFNLSLDFSETTCFNDWPRWERTWRVLASMGALQRLWLRLSWPKPALYDTEEKRFLEPFWILTHMEVFEVNLPRLKDKEKAWGKGKKPPFTVIRRTAN